MRRVGIAACVTLSAVLSGCASQPESGSNVRVDVGPTDGMSGPADFGEGEGAIEGRVIDDEFLPVAGALATLVDLDRTATTAEDGSYRFSALPAGHWTLVVASSQYKAWAQSVQVRSGERSVVNVQLVKPAGVEPYYVALPVFHGTFGCGLSLGGGRTPDFCSTFSVTEGTPRYDAGTGLTGMTSELVWTPNSALTGSKGLLFDCPQPTTNTPEIDAGARNPWCSDEWKAWREGSCYNPAGGSSPIEAACWLLPNASIEVWRLDYPYRVLMWDNSPYFSDLTSGKMQPVEYVDRQSGPIILQRWDFYHTQFYWGAEIPENYKARPDE